VGQVGTANQGGSKKKRDQCETFGELRRRLFDQLHRAIEPFELSNYDSIVSNPLATRYVAKFMHQTGLLA
jgi:hypothetical protein